MEQQDEATFLAEYDPRAYDPIAVTADVVALTLKDDRLCVLLLERGTHPFKGAWSLPGAFVGPADAEVHDAALRALIAKTDLRISHMEPLGVYGWHKRDPRMRVVSFAYVVFAPGLGEPTAGHTVRVAEWVPFEDIAGTRVMAFDHDDIVRDGVRRTRNKLEYTTLATSFLPDTFTLPDLLHVYEVVWGKAPDKGNFYRKVKASRGFIEPTGDTRGKAQLYRAGPAKMLYPPIRREGGEWE